jgi:hypothetical protein
MLQGRIQQRNYEAKETAFLLLLLPVPSQLTLATICLLLRATFIDFLQPARQIISPSVQSQERTEVLGIVNIIRTLYQNPGPVITGFLGDRGKL